MITTDEDIGMAEQTSARHRVDRWSVVTCLLLVPLASGADPEWVAGDHHIHSLHSSDGFYPVEQNARMALQHGLDWIVTTDHGGPRQSHLRILQAYPDLIAARKAIPDLIQFYGMELDSPGADHSSIIVPHTANEANVIFAIESSFSKNDPVPKDPLRDKPEHMIAALKFMGALRDKPVLIANHASRKNKIVNGKVVYGLDDPAELRLWNDTHPRSLSAWRVLRVTRPGVSGIFLEAHTACSLHTAASTGWLPSVGASGIPCWPKDAIGGSLPRLTRTGTLPIHRVQISGPVSTARPTCGRKGSTRQYYRVFAGATCSSPRVI
jgi:hypothetical protein